MSTAAIAVARQVIGSMDQAAWVIDPGGRIVMINRSALSALGYRTDDDVVGSCSHAAFHHHHIDGEPYEPSSCPILHATRRPLRYRGGTEWMIRRTGTALPVSWSASELQLDAAKLMLVTLTVLDRLDDEPFTQAVRERASALERRALYEKACDLIAVQAGDPELAPNAIAHQLHVSLRHLQTAFAEAGTSPARSIRVARLSRAANLLESGLTVTEVVGQSGFADPSTFRRAFRRHYGTPPTALRTTTVSGSAGTGVAAR
ncbi:helix-turn-helix transcriptional regulator [Nocardia mangyaensis]|uniref:helix-turn-helix transcriptional regulator n=1 Tax=Nocardia mangyaensis TaxID=2213200 RepID=UPI002674D0EC|nr:helix-turn-helix domain-containing protein [Nocardia mangyaensis]MDO3646273.1 helix-turn-helix domain-containing protein [Nocardia mangyaensis]